MTRKTQKKLRKILTLVSCAVLLVCVTVVGTIAYLQATTNTVTNTFTIGDVEFASGNLGNGLDEAAVDEYGKQEYKENGSEADRVVANEYTLLPGHTYIKDPTVHIKGGSEQAYVRMKVTLNNYSNLTSVFGSDFLPQNYVDGWDNSVWQSTNEITVEDNTATYEFWYTSIADARKVAEDKTLDLPALFTHVVIPGTVTSEQLEMLQDVTITIVADAIQADGFDNAAAAWAAWPTAA